MDAVLRAAMLAVSMVLLAAWFGKALAMKDSLLGAVSEREDRKTAERQDGQVEDALRQRLAGELMKLLQWSLPAGRLAGEWDAGFTGDAKDGRSAESAGDAGNERAAGSAGDAGGKKSAGEKLAGAAVRLLTSESPLLSFLSCETGSPAEIATVDPDPSYAGYLSRQQRMGEAWYLMMYGDENSLTGQPDGSGNGPDGLGETSDSGAVSGSGETLGTAGNGPGAFAADGNGSGSGTDRGGVPGQLAQQEPALRRMTGLTPAYHRRDGLSITGTAYVLEQLLDYDFLMQNFYSVHASTTAGRDEMNAETLLAKDLSISRDGSRPQILIYHTHSQEEFSDYSPENPEATVVGIGNYLTELLEKKGYNVIHDTTAYDIQSGELDRNHAYNYALDGITAILQRYPSIEVVLDVHRDGVRDGVRLVTEVGGKPTAQIMFFNGMSQTPDGPIEYLPNPCKEDNLAFSLQMQLDAAAYYPGFTRKIYLKGLRYNLHVRPRSALIEVGAQTNTYEEALNAMEPLAELLDMELGG